MTEDEAINNAAELIGKVAGDEWYKRSVVAAIRQGTEDWGPCHIELFHMSDPELSKDGPYRKGKCNCILLDSPPKPIHSICPTCQLEVIF